MKRMIVLIALLGSASLLWVGPASPQQYQPVQTEVTQQTTTITETRPVQAEVARTNTIIVFEPADNSDMKTRMAELNEWQQFAEQHPEIARELGRNPHRFPSAGWIERHPALQQFFSEHPQIRDEMMADPGNFVAPETLAEE